MLNALVSLIDPVFTLTWLALGTLSAAHAVMYKRDPKGATVWVFVSFSFPIVGPWLYWVFGINRVERRAIRRLGVRTKPSRSRGQPTPTNHVGAASPEVGHLGALRKIGDAVTRLPLLGGNAVAPLHNGEQAYPAMLEAIAQAKRSVTLVSYIFDWGVTGKRFATAMSDAADRGVKVHVLLDGVGALGTFSKMGRRLKKAGASVAVFFPLRFPLGRLRLNLRNHRKILVIDGRVAFTGGMNISRRHRLKQISPRRIEDLHFRVVGPVVAEIQQAFCEDWFLATKRQLSGEEYFPSLESAGPAACRTIVSGPDEPLERIHWIFQGALASAQTSVRIVTPYFIPSPGIVSAMVMAALRGVDVTLILPGKVDLPYMRWAANAFLWQILERGVRVFRRPPPFVHTKLMIVDERWVLLGSANMDRRSFRLNFELNVEVYDADLARELGEWLDKLVETSEQVTLEAMDSRPGWQRLRDGGVKLLSPYL